MGWMTVEIWLVFHTLSPALLSLSFQAREFAVFPLHFFPDYIAPPPPRKLNLEIRGEWGRGTQEIGESRGESQPRTSWSRSFLPEFHLRRAATRKELTGHYNKEFMVHSGVYFSFRCCATPSGRWREFRATSKIEILTSEHDYCLQFLQLYKCIFRSLTLDSAGPKTWSKVV